jgi:hypothetical protein
VLFGVTVIVPVAQRHIHLSVEYYS